MVFYHPETLRTMTNLRRYLLSKKSGTLDGVDAWIRWWRQTALPPFPGFFCHTLPPNQAVSIESQQRINERRNQVPPLRDIRELIIRKSRSLLRKMKKKERALLQIARERSRLLTASADETPDLEGGSVQLVVTSPPFLDVVDYHRDNWLRCWFNGIDTAAVNIWQLGDPAVWQAKMTKVLASWKGFFGPAALLPLRWARCAAAKFF